MPADFAIGPARRKKKEPPRRRPVESLATDAQGGYGLNRAREYQRKRGAAAFQGGRAAGSAGAGGSARAATRSRSPLGQALGVAESVPIVGPVARSVGSVVSGGETAAKVATGHVKLRHPSPGRLVAGTLTLGPSSVAPKPVADAVRGVLQATVDHPLAVTGKTAKGLVDAAAATPAAVVQTGIAGGKLLTGDTSGVSALAHQLSKDYARRYGPLLAGNYDAYVKRLEREGVAPELLDASVGLSSGGAVAGRAATALARRGLLGERAAAVVDQGLPRPLLREGNQVRSQSLSSNYFRARGQRAQDALRQAAYDRRVRRADVREARGQEAYRPAPTPEGQVRPLFPALERRAERIDVSRVQSRAYLGQRREKRAEVDLGLQRDLAGLSKSEQRAAFHAAQGVLPFDRGPAALRAAARQRARQIIGEREGVVLERQLRRDGWSVDAARGARRKVVRARRDGRGGSLDADLIAAGAGNRLLAAVRKHEQVLADVGRDPRVLRNSSELRALEHIDKHAEDLAGSPRLKAFQASVRERSARTEAGDPALRSVTAEARRYGPQGDAVGLPNPVIAARDRIELARKSGALSPQDAEQALSALEKRAPEMLAKWVGQVRERAGKAGLAEPSYVLHQEGVRFRRGDLTLGNVAQAMRGVRQTDLRLYREGRATANPRVLLHGVATNIKRKHQWRAVADIAERQAEPWSRKPGGGMSVHEAQREIQRQGLDPNEYAFIDMGRFRKIEEDLGISGETAGDNPALHHALQASIASAGDGSKRLPSLDLQRESFGKTRGVYVFRRGVAEELLAGTRPPGHLTRVFGKFQGLQSAAILGLNPSWLGMQVAANTLATTFGTRGAIGDLLKASPLYAQLSKADREFLDSLGGVGVLEGHTGQHLGTVGGPVVEAARRMGDTRVARTLKTVSPVRLMFLADDAQNRAFRRAVLTNAVKREAFKRIRSEAGLMAEAQARVEQLLRLKPTEGVMHQVDRILKEPETIERLAQHVNNVLGDYVRYTARERRALKPYVLFYGFFRYAMRTAFFTMPVHHPVMASIALKLGQLHVEEVKDLLGGDSAPWAYSRIFFSKNGKLSSIDLGRINPVTSPLTESVSNPKALAGLVSPMLQAAADQVYGGVVYEGGRGFHVRGSAEENRNPQLSDRGRIVLNQMLESAFPYRMAVQMTQGAGAKGDDNLLFDARPIEYKGGAARLANEQKAKRAPSGLDLVLQQLFPLFQPKPDYTREQVQKRGGVFVNGGATSAPAPASSPQPDTGLSQADQEALNRNLDRLSQATGGGLSDADERALTKALAGRP